MRTTALFLLIITMLRLSAHAQEEKPPHPSTMQEGNAHLNISFPLVNHITPFAIRDNQEEVGPLGVTIGGDYCYTKRKYVSVQLGVANARPPGEVVIPGEDGWYHDNSAVSFFINVRNNYSVRKFDFGYGLSLSKLRYFAYDVNDYTGLDTSKLHTNLALGGCFAAYFNSSRSFNIGVVYQPQFISLSGSRVFKYEHTLSIDLLFRIRVRRIKEKNDVTIKQ
ncbi:MAG: hypothetical protein KDC07_05190 [Chitinophagaceae bacterium]|nr:hypothetical protein [Chitinophagaceae bacterium]